MLLSPSRPLRCAFLSCDQLDGYVVDDDRALAAFAAAQIEVATVSWRDRSADWDRYDAVIVRSTWDYPQDPLAFFEALGRIDASRARLFNPLTAMRWNLDKRYLQDLKDAGVPIVPTRFGHGMDRERLEQLAAAFGGREWVLKPVVGANAGDTFALPPQPDPGQLRDVSDLYAHRHWMAQPFIDSVRDPGEFSLFYFNDRFSHAIVKTPRRGDFRVQEEHGGDIRAVRPSPALRAAGALAMSALPGSLLYARIDLVPDGRHWRLMEAELIEPSLYLRTCPAAPSRFAAAVREALLPDLP